MRFSLRKAVAAVALAGAVTVVAPLVPTPTAGAAFGLTIYAVDTAGNVLTLTDNLNNNAATVVAAHPVTSLVPGDAVVGIDRRPLDQRLWLVGRGASATHLYTVDPTTGQATLQFELRNVNAGLAPVVLSGTLFGIDVNPVDDTMRIVSNTGQNLHAFLVAQAGPPFRNPGDTVLDTPLSRPGVQGAAYTQNVPGVPLGTHTTQLYTVEQRRLNTQNGDGGVQTLVAPLQSFSNTSSGFDIQTAIFGTTPADFAFYARGTATNSSVYTLNLATGATDRLLTTPTGTVLLEIAL